MSLPATVFAVVLLFCAGIVALFGAFTPKPARLHEAEACKARGGVLVAGAGHELLCINKSALAARGT